MSLQAQRACALSGVALFVLFFVGFWPVSGFLTPPSPDDSAEEIARMFDEDRNRIRVGLLISMFACALFVPWSAATFVQLRRATGRHSPLAYVQVLSGTLLSLEFIYLLMFWQVAAFREDTSADTIRMLNDLAWIPFVGLTSTAVVMCLAMGFAMLDSEGNAIFPRWAGYFNIWVAFMFTPGSLCVFFKTGPFAWDGVLAWYLPISVFGIWLPVNIYLLLRAIRQQGADGPTAEPITTNGQRAVDVGQLAADVARLRTELDRVTRSAAG